MSYLFAINGVPCGIHISPDGEEFGLSERYTPEEAGATVFFKCDWLSRHALIRGLLGTVGYSNGQIMRTPPFPYPLSAGEVSNGDQLPNRMICTSVEDVRGIKFRADFDGSYTQTGIPGWPLYHTAIITARFSVPLWQVDPQGPGAALADGSGLGYVVTRTRASGEVVAPPSGAIIYNGGASAGKPLADVNAGYVRPRSEISMTLIRYPIVPKTTLENLIGSVNSAAMIIDGFRYTKGCILFTGYNCEPHPDPTSFGIVNDIELTFLANGPSAANASHGINLPLDWNYFLDPTGTWVPCVFADGMATPVFAYQDFSQFADQTIT